MMKRVLMLAGLCAFIAAPLAFAAVEWEWTIPGDMTLEATGPAGRVVTFTVTARRNEEPASVTCAPASGSTFAIRRTRVNCEALQGQQHDERHFDITVRDTTPPALTVPASFTVDATDPSGAVVTYSASATDLVDGARPVSCTIPAEARLAFGPTTVTCSASDTRANAASRSFTVTVADLSPPVVTVPRSRVVRTSQTGGAVVVFATTAADVVDGPLPTSCSRPSGSRFPFGSTGVTCRASDRAGNIGSSSFTVTVARLRSAKAGSLLSPATGTTVQAPPLLRWRATAKARFYNVQIYRAGRKVLTAWPSRTRFRLHRSWTFNGRTMRLKAGVYTWYVWPAFGTMRTPRFGKLLGQSSFRVR